jgi:hypothetical protein
VGGARGLRRKSLACFTFLLVPFIFHLDSRKAWEQAGQKFLPLPRFEVVNHAVSIDSCEGEARVHLFKQIFVGLREGPFMANSVRLPSVSPVCLEQGFCDEKERRPQRD